MRRYSVCCLAILICLSCSTGYAKPAYLTFLSLDPGTSLQKEEILLKLNKKEIPISEFFLVDTAKPDPKTLSHPAGRRQFLLLFDLVFNTSEELVEERKVAELFLSKLGKYDLIAIAGITPKAGLHVFCNFTTDRNKVIFGLNAIGKEKLDGLVEGPDGNLYSAQLKEEKAPAKTVSERQFMENVKTYQIDQKKKEQYGPVVVQSMADLGFLLSSVEGRKDVILFTPGFDTSGLAVNLELGERKYPHGSGEQARTGSQGMRNPTEIPTAEERAAAAEQERPGGAFSRVEGVEALVGFFAGSDSHIFVLNPRDHKHGFFEDLTQKTGGIYVQKGGSSAAFVDEAVSLDHVFYVVGWNDEEIRAISELCSVKLETAGEKKLSVTEKWLAPKPFAEYTVPERKAHIAQAIYKDYNQPSAGQRFWADFYFDEDLSKIPCFAQISGSEILKGGKPEFALEFYGFALSDESVVDFFSVPMKLDLQNSKLKESLSKSGMKTWNVLFGNGAEFMIRFIVINSQTGETITQSRTVQMNQSELTMTYPFFPSSNFQWTVWPKPDEKQQRRGMKITYPYTAGPNLFFPDLSPSLGKDGKEHVVYFKIYNMLPESKNPSVALDLTDQAGKSSKIDQFALMQQPTYLEHGGMELFWRLLSVPNVPPGLYQLQVNVSDKIAGKEVLRTLPLEVK